MTMVVRPLERPGEHAHLGKDVRGGAAQLERGLRGHGLDIRGAADAVRAEDSAAAVAGFGFEAALLFRGCHDCWHQTGICPAWKLLDSI